MKTSSMIAPRATAPDGAKLWLFDGTTDLLELDPGAIATELAEAGAIIFRGFKTSLEIFSRFVTKLSDRVTLDPARSFGGGTVAQKIDAGVAALGLHIENGNVPFSPDLTWFICERAPTIGSQTTICDGYQVWDAMSNTAKTAFEHDILYTRRIERKHWRRFVHHLLNGTKPIEDIGIDDLKYATRDQTGLSVEAVENGAIMYRYRTPAAHSTLFGTRKAWANSIFGPSYNYEAPTITFADGRAIDEGLLSELRQITDELTHDLEWQSGDVALIDNTRVMHGRRAIEDPNRVLFNAQSFIARRLIKPSS